MSSKAKVCLALAASFGVGILLGGYYAKPHDKKTVADEPVTQSAQDIENAPHVELVTGRPDTIDVPQEIVERLGIHTSAADPVSQSQPLRMPGSLMLDANRLARVHSRFDGHVVSLGVHKEEGAKDRALQFGDSVTKNQVLAVIWSKEIGQKKSELLDSYSQFSLNESTLNRLKTLRPGEVSEHVLRDAQRNFESSLIAVQNGERTLRSWQLAESDIKAIREEANRLHTEGSSQPAASALKTGWAEWEVRSPIDGVILEKNVTMGELIDANLDVFKIADVRQLMVVANAYEEDLPVILALPPEARRWRIYLTAEPDMPPLDGTFELAGRIIDPVQHTAQLVGWVENPQGRYMAGQFISAVVNTLPPKDQVLVPTNSVIESGEGGVLYVTTAENPHEFSRRRVVVAERGRTFLQLRNNLSDSERAAGIAGIRPGEKVVSAGVVLLENSWKELSMSARGTANSGIAAQDAGDDVR